MAEPAPQPPVQNAKPIPPLTFLGKGSYGCAIKPALPNMNNSGQWVQYPDNITKVFFDEKQGKNAVEKQKKIKNILQDDLHRINTYKVNNYTIGNIDPIVRNQCFGSDPRKYPQKLFTVRLPDLGKDMVHRSEPLLKKYRDINIKIIIEQMNKLIHQVKSYFDAGYIHGDLRETNIMINPENGQMALIDFDWFDQDKEFFRKYYSHLGFYNNPPETLMMPILILAYNQAKYPENLINIFSTFVNNELLNPSSKITKYFLAQNRMKFRGEHYINDMFNGDKLVSIFYYAILKLRSFYVSEIGDTVVTEDQKTFLKWAFIKMIESTFDGFGLGFTLLEFVSNVYGRVMFYPNLESNRKIRIDHLEKERLTNGGKKYTHDEIVLLSDALYTYIHNVLHPMAEDYVVYKDNPVRLSIWDAAARSQAIVDKLNELGVNSDKKELNRISLLASYGLPFSGGKKKTRKNIRRKKRKFAKTRKN